MKTRRILTALVAVCLPSFARALGPQPLCTNVVTADSPIQAKVIYGTDERRDIYQTNDSTLVAWAHSTVALMRSHDLTDRHDGTSEIGGENFGEEMNLCMDEPFREQRAAAFCSGSLIAPNMVLSAGHCIRSQTDCRDVRFVFGFGVDSRGSEPSRIRNDQIYRCTDIIHTQVVNSGADFSIVRLDRNVPDHPPVQLGDTRSLRVGSPLAVIGYPAGIPTKIDANKHVRNVSTTGYFQAALDTYGGNSGSAVWSMETGKVVGVLVRGDTDFVNHGNCLVSNRCSESGCRGEDVTRIEDVRQVLGQ